MDHENIKINILEFLGYKFDFFIINFDSIKYSLISSALLILFAITLRLLLNKADLDSFESNRFFFFYYCASEIRNFIKDTIGFSNKLVFNFTITVFLILIFYNLLILIPGMEEPTKNINVTIALACYVIFLINNISYNIIPKHYIDHWLTLPIKIKTKIDEKKIITLIKKLFAFIFNFIIAIILLPFHILDTLSLCLSLSFRLFGNIFGGSMVSGLVHSFVNKSLINHLIASVLFVNIIILAFFGFFEGIIQAFVFTLIGLNNIGIMTESHLSEQDKIKMEQENI